MIQETWLSAEPRSVQAARKAIRRFPAVLDRMTLRDAELLVTELVANAVTRGRARERLCLRLHLREARLRVEVYEPHSLQPSLVSSRDPTEAEIMLRILDEFASRWGHDAVATGGAKSWFELPISRLTRSPELAGRRGSSLSR